MQFGSIAEFAARILALIAVIYVAVFLQSLWVTKAPTVGQALDVQQLQQPSGAQKKRGNRARKNKKRGTATAKSAAGIETVSEEELEVVKVQSSSDVEAPSMLSPRGAFDCTLASAQKPLAGVNTDEDKSDSEAEDLEMCTDKAAATVEGDVLADTKKLEVAPWRKKQEPIEEDVDAVCEMCTNSTLYPWGCPNHCTYTSSLLLMHCQMQRVIARGPPGLEPPPATISAPSLRMCSL